MELEIKLFASLRKFNPELESIEVDDGITILELFDKAGIPPSEVSACERPTCHVRPTFT
jgi:ferredoxin